MVAGGSGLLEQRCESIRLARDLGCDSRRAFVWRRRCRCHYAELTVQGANRTGKWVHCIYCDHPDSLPKGWSPPSYYASTANALLRSMPGVRHVLTEAKALKGKHGAFDFSLMLQPASPGQPMPRLDVEVDGRQHFVCAMHGTSTFQQRALDARKDEAAWKAGRCLVRLHYLDCSRWRPVLMEALRRARLHPRQRFILYSPSYARLNKIGPLEVRGRGRKGGNHHSHRTGWGWRSLWCRRGCPF